MANNENIERINAYKVNGTWYAIRIYDNGDFIISPVSNNEYIEMINELYSRHFSNDNVDIKIKFKKLLDAKKINNDHTRDFIFKVVKRYELDKNDNKTEVEYTIERMSGKTETIGESEFKKISRELKNTYGTNDVSKLQEVGIYQEKRRRLKFVKNLVLGNRKKLVKVLKTGAILVVGVTVGVTASSIGKDVKEKFTQPKPLEDDNNNKIESQVDGDFFDYTPGNQTEITYNPSTPIPTLESQVSYVEPQEVSSYCEISYINENGQEVLPRERIEKDEYGSWLNQAYEEGNDANFGGVDAIGNNLNNPEKNPRPEYVNLINYVNVVDDQSDMIYITALANARNEISKTYITGSDYDNINNKIVDANKLLVYLIKHNGLEYNSGKTFDTLSPEAQNLALQISQQIYRPLCSVNMTFTDDMSGEIIDYNVMTDILVDAYDKINNGYSK